MSTRAGKRAAGPRAGQAAGPGGKPVKNENAFFDAMAAADAAVAAAKFALLLLAEDAPGARAYADAARQLCLAAARAAEAQADQLPAAEDAEDEAGQEAFRLHRLAAGRAAEAQRYAERLG